MPCDPVGPVIPCSPCGPTICPTEVHDEPPHMYKSPSESTTLASLVLLPTVGKAPGFVTDALTLIDVPCGPVGPVGPCNPVAPVGPVGPVEIL